MLVEYGGQLRFADGRPIPDLHNPAWLPAGPVPWNACFVTIDRSALDAVQSALEDFEESSTKSTGTGSGDTGTERCAATVPLEANGTAKSADQDSDEVIRRSLAEGVPDSVPNQSPHGSDHRCPGQLIWGSCQILALSERAIKAGRAILKIRELYPEEPSLRIEEISQLKVNLKSLEIYLAPRCPTEDPRGGRVPLYHRSSFAEWFSANPDVEKLFQALWDARVDLPTTFTRFERNLTDENLIRFKSALGDFERLVARFRNWYESVCPSSNFFSSPATSSFPGTAAEYSNMLRSIWQSQEAEAIAAARAVPASETAGAKPFEAGTVVYFQDRVELCGVDICSGPKCGPARKVLDALGKKGSDGKFVAYSGKQLAEITGKQEATVSGLMRDLRNRISAVLLSESGIRCGNQDVIVTSREGYRFSKKLSVEDVPRSDNDSRTGRAVRNPVRNVRNASVRNRVRNDVRNDSDNTPACRREWILKELADGRYPLAPDVVKKFGCVLKTAQRDFQKLVNLREIEFLGSPNAGRYRLVNADGQAGS
ncbi:MAG: hypothetical protein EXS09_22525 [Gemmataceae bacterium]|nr:hypothetical protein [Gemmataceae bacterium]